MDSSQVSGKSQSYRRIRSGPVPPDPTPLKPACVSWSPELLTRPPDPSPVVDGGITAPCDAEAGTQSQDVNAAEWIERTDPDGRRILERADVAGLEIIDPPPPCPKCNRFELWQDVAGGWHCATCNPAPDTGERLRRLRSRINKRFPKQHGPRPVDWPAAQADFVLLLTPDDLPPVPFRLTSKTTVHDRERFLKHLKTSIRIGPTDWYARRGILQDELRALHRLLIQGFETVSRV